MGINLIGNFIITLPKESHIPLTVMKKNIFSISKDAQCDWKDYMKSF